MAKWFEKNRKQTALDVLAGLLLGAVCLVLFGVSAFMQPAENLVRDTYNKIAAYMGETPPNDIVLVNIDSNSVQWAQSSLLNQEWPWSTRLLLSLDYCLQQCGARSIAYDVSLPTNIPSAHVLEMNKESLKFNGNDWIWTHVVRGVLLGDRHAQRHLDHAQKLQINRKLFTAPPRIEPGSVGEASRAVLPHPVYDHVLKNLANIALVPDSDGIHRANRPLMLYDGMLVPSLGVAAYLAGSDDRRLALDKNTLRLGGRTFPLDNNGNLLLRFTDDSKIKEFTAKQVLSAIFFRLEGLPPLVRKEDFRDKFVLVRFTGNDTQDNVATPLSATSNSTLFHAQVLRTLLHGTVLSPLPDHIGFPFLLCCIVLACASCAGLPSFIWGIMTVELLFLPLIAGFILYEYGIVAPVASGTVAGLLGVVLTFFLRYFHEWQRRQAVQRTLNYYMNPVITEQLLNNPEQLELGGEEYDITMLFSDLANFTAASSHKTPAETITFLNEYLEAMSSIIFDEGGCIDKYIGDAIVAFWNVPVARADHADRAVSAALRCQTRILELQQVFKRRFGFDLASRIGIHTGKSIVGNVGSEKFRNYTAIGSTVNLASRLEGANKHFGTRILVSGATHAALTGTGADFLDLGKVRVVGQHDTVHVYEPWGRNAQPQLEIFNKATAAFGAGKFAEAQDLYSQCGDIPASAAMLRYCQIYLAGRPWQGYIELDAK